MSTRRQWLALGLAAWLGHSVGWFMAIHLGPDRQSKCEALAASAQISQRATDICTGELIGCSLSFEQVERIVAAHEAAKDCQ